MDQTNTDSCILPCKVLKVGEDSPVPYQLYTNSGILQTKFSADEIQEMKNVCFPELNLPDPNELKEISVIQLVEYKTEPVQIAIVIYTS